MRIRREVKRLFGGRQLRRFDDSCNCGSVYCTHDRINATNPGEADLVSSDLVAHPGLHMPVIDLDIPCQLVPSATPGHSHLYIDKAVSWTDFQEVLVALARAGIIEHGFVDATIERGFASVRVPWKPKGTAS